MVRCGGSPAPAVRASDHVAHDRARVTAPEPPETLHHRDRAAFVALVPGALSLTSVADAAEGHTGITGIAVAGSAVLSLALGTM